MANAREIAMLYGEIRPTGHFRSVNFGHPPPLIRPIAARSLKWIKSEWYCFRPLGLEVRGPPDRNRYSSVGCRQREEDYFDVADIALIRPGDRLFLYTDGVYDGSDDQVRQTLEGLFRQYFSFPQRRSAKA